MITRCVELVKYVFFFISDVACRAAPLKGGRTDARHSFSCELVSERTLFCVGEFEGRGEKGDARGRRGPHSVGHKSITIKHIYDLFMIPKETRTTWFARNLTLYLETAARDVGLPGGASMGN